MIRVALGSENPVKISAVKEALETLKLDYEL
ncbi:purine NTP phosphatase, partial [Sulfolobus sp. A20-N-G8]